MIGGITPEKTTNGVTTNTTRREAAAYKPTSLWGSNAPRISRSTPLPEQAGSRGS